MYLGLCTVAITWQVRSTLEVTLLFRVLKTADFHNQSPLRTMVLIALLWLSYFQFCLLKLVVFRPLNFVHISTMTKKIGKKIALIPIPPNFAHRKLIDLPSYRIYSINRPGCLLNFWTLWVGDYSRWALIKFSPFSTSVVCIFCNKTINGNNKTRRCNKATFLQNTLKKTPSSGKSLVRTYSFLGGWALI